jgi:iron complex transport system ATP-binding protein
MISLRLDSLRVGYGRKLVAGPLDGWLPAGQFSCLLGRNGTGKSSLLRTLAGLQPSVGGQVVGLLDDRQVDPAGKVGIVLTHRVEGIHLSVRELVGLGRMPHTGFLGRLGQEDRRVVEWAMCETCTDGLASRQVETLSDGEFQRVMLARVLAQQTPVVLADEATAFLDYPSKREVMRLLRQMAHDLGLAVLLSTHDVPLAMEEADRLWLLSSPKTGAPSSLLEGTPQSLAAAVGEAMRHAIADNH